MLEDDNKIKWWSSDYSLKEKMSFLRDRLFLPYSKNQNEFRTINNHEKIFLPNFSIDLRIGFLGDIMPINGKKLIIDKALENEFKKLDILVVNLEGIITTKKRYLALSHDYDILEKIRNLSKDAHILFNLANNHSSDFGKSHFIESKKVIEEFGFKTFGTSLKPYLDFKNFRFYGASYWCNQNLDLVNSFNYSELRKINSSHNKDKICIFLPHWGYEMQLYPHKNQINFANQLKNWDLIIGCHSHCPQPIIYNDDNPQAVAFSLGNFCYSHYNPNHYNGAFLSISFNLQNDKPKLVEQKFMITEMYFENKNIIINNGVKLKYLELRKRKIAKKLKKLSKKKSERNSLKQRPTLYKSQ